MKKRIFVIFLASLIIIACLGKSTGNALNIGEYYSTEKLLDIDDVINITVWHQYNAKQKEKFDSLIDLFNTTDGRKYGVFIKSVRRAGSAAEIAIFLKNALEEKIGADAVPDIFAAYPDTAYEFNKMGALASLNKYFTQSEKEEYIPGFLYSSGFGITNDIKLFPIAKATENLILNRTAWKPFAEEKGLSYQDLKTWEDIVRVAELYYEWTDKLTAKPYDGKPFFGRDSASNYVLVGSYELGKDIFTISENNEVSYKLDKNILKRLWENYYVPLVKGLYFAEGRFRSDDLKTGKIISLIGSTSASIYLPQTIVDKQGKSTRIDLEILPLPHFKDVNLKAAVQQGSGMAVIKSSLQKELAAVLFLKWFTKIEQNTSFALDAGYLPVKKEALRESNIHSATKVLENKIAKYIPASITTSIETIHSSALYAQPGFKHANEARAVLFDFIHTRAMQKKRELEKFIDNRALYSKNLKYLISEKSFEDWFAELQKELSLLK